MAGRDVAAERPALLHDLALAGRHGHDLEGGVSKSPSVCECDVKSTAFSPGSTCGERWSLLGRSVQRRQRHGLATGGRHAHQPRGRRGRQHDSAVASPRRAAAAVDLADGQRRAPPRAPSGFLSR